MIVYLDTNVLVGLALGASDTARFDESRRSLEHALLEGLTPLVTECVLCESFWVLESRYGIGRSVVASRIYDLLDTAALGSWDQPLVSGALLLQIQEPRLDIADCLLIIRSSLEAGAVLTFDKLLSRVMGEVEIVEL